MSGEMESLRQRVADLERVLAALPMYIDNWKWAEENVDVLKTVSGMRFHTPLEKRIGWLEVGDDGCLHETGKRQLDEAIK